MGMTKRKYRVSPTLTGFDPPWIFFCGSSLNTILTARNHLQSMNWEQPSKETVLKYQLNWLITFLVQSVSVVQGPHWSTIWTLLIIGWLLHLFTLFWVIKLLCNTIIVSVVVTQRMYIFYLDTLHRHSEYAQYLESITFLKIQSLRFFPLTVHRHRTVTIYDNEIAICSKITSEGELVNTVYPI